MAPRHQLDMAWHPDTSQQRAVWLQLCQHPPLAVVAAVAVAVWLQVQRLALVLVLVVMLAVQSLRLRLRVSLWLVQVRLVQARLVQVRLVGLLVQGRHGLLPFPPQARPVLQQLHLPLPAVALQRLHPSVHSG